MRLIYTKPKLRDLSQGSRIAFVRQFRFLTQDDVSENLVWLVIVKEELWQDMKKEIEILKMKD